MNISVCNRTKSIQFRIVHRTHITPVVKNKMDSNISPLCWKCRSETGSYVHCLWSCVKLQSYWSSIVIELTIIFGVPIRMDPMCLILGLPDDRITDSKHIFFNILSFAARKKILLFWNKNVAPTKKSWHNIVMDCIPSEYITCMLQSKIDAFYKVWDPYLQHIGPTLSSSLLRGFPRSA